jgi:hypothetical protein
MTWIAEGWIRAAFRVGDVQSWAMRMVRSSKFELTPVGLFEVDVGSNCRRAVSAEEAPVRVGAKAQEWGICLPKRL